VESASNARRGCVERTHEQEAKVTEIEERIESQRESAQLMRKAMDCECPDTACTVAHES
jgi:hypothetical protein